MVEGDFLGHVDKQFLHFFFEMDSLDWYDTLGLALYGDQTLHLLQNFLHFVGFYAVEADDADEEALGLVEGGGVDLIVDHVVPVIICLVFLAFRVYLVNIP